MTKLASETPSQPLDPKLPSFKKEKSLFWSVFLSTFITIFLAEMGDKTQLATLLIAAESGSPWIVFTGAALALIATSLLGVLLGILLAKRLAVRIQEIAVGALLIIVSVGLLWDAVH